MSSNSASAHSCEDTTSPAPEGVAPMNAEATNTSGIPNTSTTTNTNTESQSNTNSPSQYTAEVTNQSIAHTQNPNNNTSILTTDTQNTEIINNNNGVSINNNNGVVSITNDSNTDTPPVTISPDGINTCPTVEMKLFVGRVPRNIEEKELKPIFEEFGQVREVVIIKDKNTGQHKGSAFVRMASLTSSDSAIRSLHNQRVLDQGLGALQVRYATGEVEKLGLNNDGAIPGQDEAKLFVGSIPKTATEEEVKNVFETYGTINEVFIMKDMTTGMGRGCSFVKFAYKEQAVNAIEKLNQKYTMAGATRPMEVRFAEHKKAQMATSIATPNIAAVQPVITGLMGARPMTQAATAVSNSNPRQIGQWKEYFSPDGRPYYHSDITNVTQWDPPLEFQYLSNQVGVHQHMGAAAKTNTNDPTGPPGANVFIFHVPNDWTNNELTNAFGQFGHVVSAHIATDKASGRNRGFAFVSYDDTKAAVAAVTHMNGFMVHGKRLKVSIKSGEESFVRHLMPPNGSIGQQTNVSQAINVSQAVPTMGSQLGLNSLMNAQIAGAPPQMASSQQAVPAAAPGYAGYAGYATPHGGNDYFMNAQYAAAQYNPQYGQSQFQSQMDKQQYNKQYEQQSNPPYGNMMEGQAMDMSAYHSLS